ncbi:hypothetical protein L9F63_014526 [Diploptera punctata]|uniref:Threonylcarbamoyl-AMP synthase n=1 Tax=Diploptera punctata TaxID=6984 RepID=A0AAD8A7T1_DIPPU|nr:hypothetical protein L9F63_014526 [Diploptera punctata]
MFSLNDISDLNSAVDKAAELIINGGVIAVPTDTIYGLATSAQNSQAISHLYEIKGRDPNKPIAICVGDIDSIPLWGRVDDLPLGLLENLLPGPVTIVVKRTSLLNPLLNPGISSVGIRIPNHKFIQRLCKKIGMPLALTSANLSNEPSALSPEEFKNIWSCLSSIFHNGTIGDSPELRAGSTIVDLSVPGCYHIVRPGNAFTSTCDLLEKFGLKKSL